ncbi:MAG: hypothetical protein ACYCPQ_11050 [Elusimicrobiota bacterium]
MNTPKPEHQETQVSFGNSFQQHHIFGDLDKYAEFYRSLSTAVFSFLTPGTNAACNIDSYVFSSIQGTLESIKGVLKQGRINDAYALLRKYYDAAIINVYSALYLKSNFSIQNMVVARIDNWFRGKEPLPKFHKMVKYIRAAPDLAEITRLLDQESPYRDLRQRCNDHTHYNAYHNLLLNDNAIHIPDRLAVVEGFSKDVDNVFVLHIAYLFYLNDHYMSSSDYLDHLECGMQPPEGSQYSIAPFVQDIFESVINKKRMDIALAIKNRTAMQLE